MAKLLLTAASATGMVATTVPTVVLASDGNELIVEVQKPPGRSRTPNWNVKRKISGLTYSSAIKSEYKNIDCLKEQFGEGGEWGNDTQHGSPKTDSIDDNNSNLKGCLIIEYYKQSYKDNKWWGEFKLVWSLASSNRGIVISFHSKTNNGKITIDARAYTLKKNNNDWKIEHGQIYPTTDLNKNTLNNKFPKLGNSIQSKDDLDFNPLSGDICKANECTDDNKEEPAQKSVTWEFKKEGSDPITNWNDNFNTWFDSVFHDNTWTEVKNKLQTLTGSWQIKASS